MAVRPTAQKAIISTSLPLDSNTSSAYIGNMKMLTVRIPEELHKALKVKCAVEGVDMASVITKLIEGYVKETKPKKQK
jgi:hypothetical protein